jgi:uncharacterized protein
LSLDLFVILLLASSVIAGFFGALTGLGGGVVLIPLLVFGFQIDLRYAIGTSLVAVIATSSGAAAAFVREGFTNVRVAILLEVATTLGAIVGALIAKYLQKDAIAVVFGAVMIYSAMMTVMALRKPSASAAAQEIEPDPIAARLRLDSTYPGKAGELVSYRVRNATGGFAVMGLAGVLSALVGIGSGVIKVVAMDRMMRLPFKVSTTTSNFMMGVTAAASAGVYLTRGQLEPLICGPVAMGALVGSMVGARLLPRIQTKWLRIVFAIFVTFGGIQMIYRGLTGGIG